jgi:glutamate 5-kinase
MTQRAPISGAKRVIVKLGTQVLTGHDGQINRLRISIFAEEISKLIRSGQEVLLVTSGAVGLGRADLGLAAPASRLSMRQACAAVGQSHLMALYSQAFAEHGITIAQVLLTEADLDDRVRYLNLRSTLLALLEQGVVPILNENDAVSTSELAFVDGDQRPVFGDNDRLSALVATKLSADLLIMLTDVEGLYSADPSTNPDAVLLGTVAPGEVQSVLQMAGGTSSAVGRGGMKSKVEAADVAARSGCEVVIASGRSESCITRIAAAEPIGTWFPATAGLSARDRWLAFAAAPRGTLHLDRGAVRALQAHGASLLAIGVQSVQGEFDRGDVVSLVDPEGAQVGRGMVHCDAETAREWAAGKHPDRARNHDALVHRDHMFLERNR